MAFAAWLEERSSHLPQLVIGARKETGLEFAFEGWPELEASVTAHGLDIAAMRDGECWDLLLSLDVEPVGHGAEWGCAICDGEGRPARFPTRETLWRDHLFDPLEMWIVTTLAPAARVEFHRIGRGSTWARLAQL